MRIQCKCVFTPLVALALGALASGCGGSSDGPKLNAVSGVVTFDGEPIKEGRILFRALGAGGRSYSAPIANGAYDVKAEAGPVAVEVTASRLVPGKVDRSNPVPEPAGEMYIPKRYSGPETTLKAEVKPGGNTLPFALTTK